MFQNSDRSYKMTVYETDENKYLGEIVDIHLKTFKGFFLTELGEGFLKTLYKGYMKDEASGIIVAVEENKVVGFIAYSKDYARFYKNLIKRSILQFAFYSIIAAIKHPSFIGRLLGAFGKSDEVTKKEEYVELASIGVNPLYKGKGVGTQLISFLKENTDYNEYEYIALETDADNNDNVNRFYVKNGFELVRTYSTKQGRRMNEYHYGE